MEYNWTPAQIDTIVKSIFNRMNNKEEADKLNISQTDTNKYVLEIKDAEDNSRRYGGENYFCLSYYIDQRKLSLTVGKTQGVYCISWLPWKDKDLKRLINYIRYAINHATELRATQSIHKLFPDAVTREFEKTVLK